MENRKCYYYKRNESVTMRKRRNEDLTYLNGRKRLSATEFAFMQLIWDHPEGISSEEIYSDKQFTQAQKTKSVILFNISEKGYVRNIQKGRHHIYFPQVGKIEYEQALLMQQIMDSFGSVSFAKLVAAFCGRSQLTEKETERVEGLLEDIKSGGIEE